jgi:serine-type D-Ala-D-Ala carboxypeptidase (penicillin-binding protein 5/6)
MRRVLLICALIPCALAGGPALAQSPPPPTTVPVPCPDGSGTCASPSPFPTELETPAPSTIAPEVEAGSAILMDLDTGQVLFTQDPDRERPVASTTKIMTSLVALSRVNPQDLVTVGPNAAAEGARGFGFSALGLREGERRTVMDLLYALLLQSSNDAAVAVAEHVSGTVSRFVADMNEVVLQLGLFHTEFASPNGLDDGGYSTARQMATIARVAYRDPLLSRIMTTQFHDIPSPSGEPRHIQNRNVHLWLYPGSLGGKTGYTSASGFCLVTAAERDGRRLLVVVLGEPSSVDSFSDAAALLDHGFAGFRERRLVERGEDLEPVPVGDAEIEIEAATALTRLVPAEGGEVRRRVILDRGLQLPLEVGDRIGRLSFTVGDRPLGAVPVVVGAIRQPSPMPAPSPSPGEPAVPARDPWWIWAIEAAAGLAVDALLSVFG